MLHKTKESIRRQINRNKKNSGKKLLNFKLRKANESKTLAIKF